MGVGWHPNFDLGLGWNLKHLQAPKRPWKWVGKGNKFLAWVGGRNQIILCDGHKTWGIGLGWGKKLNYSMCWTQDMGYGVGLG